MYEYAISDGEGTLVEYGVGDIDDMFEWLRWDLRPHMTLIVAPCPGVCETGR